MVLLELRRDSRVTKFQRTARRDKKAFLSDRCKEIEENTPVNQAQAWSWVQAWAQSTCPELSAQGLVPLRWGCALPSPNAPGKAYHSYSTKETENQRGQVAYPGSHSQPEAGPEIRLSPVRCQSPCREPQCWDPELLQLEPLTHSLCVPGPLCSTSLVH